MNESHKGLDATEPVTREFRVVHAANQTSYAAPAQPIQLTQAEADELWDMAMALEIKGG